MQKYETILTSAHSLLGRKMYTKRALFEKLMQRHPDAKETIDRVIRECEEVDLINDKKYAEAFVESRMLLKPKGKRVLHRELREKGVPENIIKETLSDISEEEEEKMARGIAQRKIKLLAHEKDMQKREEKLFRFLASRGFDFSLSRKIAQEYAKR